LILSQFLSIATAASPIASIIGVAAISLIADENTNLIADPSPESADEAPAATPFMLKIFPPREAMAASAFMMLGPISADAVAHGAFKAAPADDSIGLTVRAYTSPVVVLYVRGGITVVGPEKYPSAISAATEVPRLRIPAGLNDPFRSNGDRARPIIKAPLSCSRFNLAVSTGKSLAPVGPSMALAIIVSLKASAAINFS
jgi:hypothetical protein